MLNSTLTTAGDVDGGPEWKETAPPEEAPSPAAKAAEEEAEAEEDGVLVSPAAAVTGLSDTTPIISLNCGWFTQV